MFSVVASDVGGKLHSLIEVPAVFFSHILIRHLLIDWHSAYALPKQAIKMAVAYFVDISFRVSNIR